jgi:hypothetical protein
MLTRLNRRSLQHAVVVLTLAIAADIAAGQEAPPGPGTPAPGFGGGGRPAAGGQPGVARPGGNAPGGVGGLGGGGGSMGFSGGVGRGRDISPKSKLEEMLEKALKNNPDLHVAAAKVQEAEAELNRTRLEVTRKVVRLYASLDAARIGVERGEHRLTEVRQLAEKNAISKEEVRTVEKEVAEAKAQLAATEAEASYLLGEQSPLHRAQVDFSVPLSLARIAGVGMGIEGAPPAFGGAGGAGFGGMGGGMSMGRRGANGSTAGRLPEGKIADRIHAFLDSPVTVNFTNESLTQMLMKYEKEFNVTFIISGGVNGLALNFRCEDMPIGTVLQAVGDAIGCEFVVRDYGILVLKEGALPAGAVRLNDFWKMRQSIKEAVPDTDKERRPK